MKKFRILIEELVSQEFEITAESEEDALASARAKYKKAEFVLEPGEVKEVKLSVINEEKGLYMTEKIL